MLGGGMAIPSAPVATAAGYLALLKEEDPVLQRHALEKLLGCVDTAWHEIAESLVDLERLAEDSSKDAQLRQMSAAVASRVFYSLEEPTQALRLALEAGEAYFSPLSPTPYEQRLVAAALDTYIHHQQQGNSSTTTNEGTGAAGATSRSGDGSDGISLQQLQQMIRRLITTSCQAGSIEHAIGIAMEAQEMEILREILAVDSSSSSSSSLDTVRYALKAAECLDSKLVRVQALGITAESLQARFDATDSGDDGSGMIDTGTATATTATDTKSAVSADLVLIYQRLKQPEKVAAVLTALLDSPKEAHGLLALQICFDLMDSGNSDFTKALATHLFPGGSSEDGSAEPSSNALLWAQAKKVLVGGFGSELALSFLHKHSSADRLVMEQLRKSLEERSSRSSILHNAGVVAHSYLYAGTTNDSFLRDHLDWMKKASNWYGSWQKSCAGSSLPFVPVSHSDACLPFAYAGQSSQPLRPLESSIPCTLPRP
jgi:26S proteasome regulatory subunit N2